MIFADVEVQRYDEEGDSYQETLSFGFPDKLGEITLKQWCKFQIERNSLPEKITALLDSSQEDQDKLVEEWRDGDWAQYYLTIARLLACFSDQEMSGVLALPAEAFEKSFGNSILAMFQTVMQVVASYQPTKRSSFKYKGKTYIIPQAVVDSYGIATPGKKLTTIEAVQALQSDDVLRQLDEEGNFVVDNHLYHVDLAILAALCRRRLKTGDLEIMPYGIDESEQFMQKRMKLFEGIPMDVARDVYFFLTSSKLLSVNTRLSQSLLSLRQVMLKKLSSS